MLLQLLTLNPTKEGFVYVITTSYLESNDTYKIGYTKNFLQRLDTFNEYRHSSEPQYFATALYKTSDARTLEAGIHRKLACYRDEGEFFKCDIETIKEAFEAEECVLEPYN
jgi:predicted GIY-YIG superfamily endonuclease